MQAVDALNTRGLRARASPRLEGLALPLPPRTDSVKLLRTSKDSVDRHNLFNEGLQARRKLDFR